MKKISASTLVLTVVVALILSILCASVILLAYYNRGYQSDWLINEKLAHNTASAINIVLADTTFVNDKIDTLDLFEEGHDSVIIKREVWGLFHVASIRALKGRFFNEKSFMYGVTPPEYMNGCLYVADHHNILSVIGKTKLTGNVYLSKAGIRPGYINQRGFDFDKVVDGQIKESEEQLPEVQEAHLASIKQLFNHQADSAQYIDDTETFSSDSADHLFRNDLRTFSFSGERILQNITIKGKCIVFCDSILEVDPSAVLENIILVAPVIKFHEQWSGTVQAFAFDSIVIENNCRFNYPSAIGIIKEHSHSLQPQIRIGEECTVSGVLLGIAANEDIYKTYIELGKGSILNGVVYCQGHVNLKGNISGIVLADYFMYKNGITAYDNYLVDVEINRESLSRYFLLPTIFTKAHQREVVQWLP